jgi:hypothetical protein
MNSSTEARPFSGQRGAHRLPPRGSLVQEGEVEVTVEGEREGAGDRRRRHDEHVGVLAHVGEGETLLHAEAVLLVHHHQAETVEAHAVLDEGVGADHELGRPLLDAQQRGAALGGAHPPGEELYLHGERAHERAQGAEVLLRQDLRRRHQRPLVAVLHRAEEREERHHGLTGAHVALEQAVHAPGRPHVVADLPQDAALGAGQREGERLVEGADERLLPRELDPRALRRLLVVDDGVQELQEEDLRLRERLGAVQRPQRLAELGDAGLRAQLRVQHLLGGGGREEVVQVVGDELADLALRETLRGGVDREDRPPLGGDLLPLARQDLVLAGLELTPVEEADGTGEEEEVSAAQEAVEEGLARPGALDEPAPVAHDRLEDAQPLPRGEHPLGDDAPHDGRLHPRLQRPDLLDGRRVLVAARDVIEHVARGEQPELREQVRALRAHPFQELRGTVEIGIGHGSGNSTIRSGLPRRSLRSRRGGGPPPLLPPR